MRKCWVAIYRVVHFFTLKMLTISSVWIEFLVAMHSRISIEYFEKNSSRNFLTYFVSSIFFYHFWFLWYKLWNIVMVGLIHCLNDYSGLKNTIIFFSDFRTVWVSLRSPMYIYKTIYLLSLIYIYIYIYIWPLTGTLFTRDHMLR